MMFGKRILCVITGASRGYGRTLALVLAEAVGASSTFLLLARGASGLSETRDLMLKKNPNLRIETCVIDLESADTAELSNCLSRIAPTSDAAFEVGLLLHNSGSSGDSSLRAKEHSSRNEVLSYCGLNIVSPVVLTSAYLSMLSTAAGRHIIVNISSIAALQPLPSLSLYSTGKAARDMFFRCLAVEEPSLKVLNWAPGPMATAMVDQIKTTSFDPELRATFNSDSFAIDITLSAKHFLALLERDDFESGAHVDIYDVWNPKDK